MIRESLTANSKQIFMGMSGNGTSWTLVDSSTNTTFASTCYIGLAVGSGSDTTLNATQFSNASVTP